MINSNYYFRRFLFVLRFLSSFDPFLYQQASCWDRKFLQVPQGTSDLSLTSALTLLSCCLLLFLFLAVPLSFPALPLPFFSSTAIQLWAVIIHGTAPGLSFRSSCFLLVRPRVFQRLQSFQVFLSERQKPMWRSCPDVWESAAQQ